MTLIEFILGAGAVAAAVKGVAAVITSAIETVKKRAQARALERAEEFNKLAAPLVERLSKSIDGMGEIVRDIKREHMRSNERLDDNEIRLDRHDEVLADQGERIATIEGAIG